MSIEAMKQALRVFEKAVDHLPESKIDDCINSAIALRQAIDQAEKQEHDLNDVRCECCGYMTYHREHMGCIKAAYQQAKKQDPVAWMTNSEQDVTAEFLFSHVQTPIHNIPLYEAPPKREWVGLTDEEIAEGQRNSWVDKQAFESAVWWAEERLKDKNRD